MKTCRKIRCMESCNRPGVAQRVPGGLGSKISMTFSTWRWWGCRPHTPAAFTPRKCSWYSFSLGAQSNPGQWYDRKEYVTKKSSDTTGNRSGTVRLVAQRLNHYDTPGKLDVQLQSFLILALEGSDCPTSGPCRFTPEKNSYKTATHWMWASVGLRANLEDSNLGPSSP
jgi:hypothetical protein